MSEQHDAPPPSWPAPTPYGQAPGPYGHAGAPYGQPYPAARPTNTMAVLSLVFAFVLAPLGVVFGHIARKQMRQTGEGGEGLALAGLIIGYLGVAIFALYVVFIVFVVVMGATTNP